MHGKPEEKGIYGNDDDKNKVEKEGKKSYPHQYFTRHVSESVSSGPKMLILS